MTGDPRWIPLNSDGTRWQLLSYKGRCLGKVTRVCPTSPIMATKFCGHGSRECDSWWSAGRYVLTTLECVECAVKRFAS